MLSDSERVADTVLATSFEAWYLALFVTPLAIETLQKAPIAAAGRLDEATVRVIKLWAVPDRAPVAANVVEPQPT